MKIKRIIIFAAAIGLMVAGVVVSSSDIMSPYVSFSDPKLKNGDYVQIMGKYDKSKPAEQRDGVFSFSVKNDAGETLTITRNGVKPLNFEHAEQVAILGRYNSQSGIFEANNILTKCPSKYQKEK